MNIKEILKYVLFFIGIGLFLTISAFLFGDYLDSLPKETAVIYFNIWGGLLILLTLLLFGILGPKRFREWIKKWYTFEHKDSALFFPLDPHKPLQDAIKEGANNFLPTKERFNNWLNLMVASVVATIIFSIVFFIFVYYFFR